MQASDKANSLYALSGVKSKNTKTSCAHIYNGEEQLDHLISGVRMNGYPSPLEAKQVRSLS